MELKSPARTLLQACNIQQKSVSGTRGTILSFVHFNACPSRDHPLSNGRQSGCDAKHGRRLLAHIRCLTTRTRPRFETEVKYSFQKQTQLGTAPSISFHNVRQPAQRVRGDQNACLLHALWTCRSASINKLGVRLSFPGPGGEGRHRRQTPAATCCWMRSIIFRSRCFCRSTTESELTRPTASMLPSKIQKRWPSFSLSHLR